ncbi:MAG: UDP-2,3-diacylglucosamine hydrolase [Arcobacter sp.]|nr:MAG: UDP-2,3-diacylglucosamine hydrolase [Arcobacter sp.]
MYLNIQKGAIFVADSHYNEKKPEFLIFLKKLVNKEISTTQLFLMGDMFDFISGESKYFIKRNQELIDIINKLSTSMQIVYFEGNHDYNMKSLFKNILVIPREEQPLCGKFQDRSVEIAHGDIFTPWHYNLYCSIIRNHFLLTFLNFIDFNNLISKKIYYSLIEKNICSKMDNFDEFALKRLNNYKSEIVIEGHFHQGKSFINNNQLYVNIPSLCCDKKYFILEEEFRGENL